MRSLAFTPRPFAIFWMDLSPMLVESKRTDSEDAVIPALSASSALFICFFLKMYSTFLLIVIVQKVLCKDSGFFVIPTLFHKIFRQFLSMFVDLCWKIV